MDGGLSTPPTLHTRLRPPVCPGMQVWVQQVSKQSNESPQLAGRLHKVGTAVLDCVPVLVINELAAPVVRRPAAAARSHRWACGSDPR